MACQIRSHPANHIEAHRIAIGKLLRAPPANSCEARAGVSIFDPAESPLGLEPNTFRRRERLANLTLQRELKPSPGHGNFHATGGRAFKNKTRCRCARDAI